MSNGLVLGGAFILVIVLGWLVRCWCLAWISGWAQLAKHYREDKPLQNSISSGIGLGFILPNLGECSYLRSTPYSTYGWGPKLNFGVDLQGLHLSVSRPYQIGNPPLCIPWEDITLGDMNFHLGGASQRRVLMRFEKVPLVNLNISATIALKLKEDAAGFSAEWKKIS